MEIATNARIKKMLKTNHSCIRGKRTYRKQNEKLLKEQYGQLGIKHGCIAIRIKIGAIQQII